MQLKLDADWVILSACNTAAPDGSEGAEGLSGLAKAFFYAGARAVLVSHWPVNSRATVRLITGTIEALAREPAIGRAEALRRATLAMIDTAAGTPGSEYFSHPMFWAPFVIVGEGGAGR
jgi:CHAT domain-containing protein